MPSTRKSPDAQGRIKARHGKKDEEGPKKKEPERGFVNSESYDCKRRAGLPARR